MDENERKALLRRFHEQMLGVYERALDECKYPATRFLRLVSEQGGFEAARTLLTKEVLSYGFEKLWECRRLDLTMEVLVLHEPWRQLFSNEELETARRRLADLGYEVEG